MTHNAKDMQMIDRLTDIQYMGTEDGVPIFNDPLTRTKFGMTPGETIGGCLAKVDRDLAARNG